jgi:tetratricopeptide (TPR) repeat protein
MVSRALPAALIAASFFIASTAMADKKPKKGKKPTKSQKAPPPAATHPEVDALSKTIVDAATHADRMAAAKALVALGAEAIPAMVSKLNRKHASGDAFRRKVLKKIKADVPNKKGKFRQPKRTKKKTEMKGYTDIFLDAALIRALAATNHHDAATAIVDFGFTDDGMLMRDECGRYLRNMHPYSLPALIHGSQLSKKSEKFKRGYAIYQLERLDRQNPHKAVAAGFDDEVLQADILRALSTSGYRDGVHAVIRYIDDPSATVRTAARDAWMGYVTGPEPPLAPRKKLKQPHGQYTKKAVPMYLNYRELATFELHQLTEQVFGRKPGSSESLEKLSKDLFEHYDSKRAEKIETEFDRAFGLADDGELDKAASLLDQMLVIAPDYGKRDRMADIYVARAVQLENSDRWRDAAATYSKAHGVAPEGEAANDALASHHFATGKALEADGKDGSASFAKAKKLNPKHVGASRSAKSSGGSGGGNGNGEGRPKWMLYAGIGGGGAALLLLVIGLARRRS